MTNKEMQKRFEEVNLELYQRIEKEFEEFKEKVLQESPEEILTDAYELAVKEDIVFSLMENNIELGQAEALLKREHPLEDIYDQYEHSASERMTEIYEAIRDCARKFEVKDIIKQCRSKEQER